MKFNIGCDTIGLMVRRCAEFSSAWHWIDWRKCRNLHHWLGHDCCCCDHRDAALFAECATAADAGVRMDFGPWPLLAAAVAKHRWHWSWSGHCHLVSNQDCFCCMVAVESEPLCLRDALALDDCQSMRIPIAPHSRIHTGFYFRTNKIDRQHKI